MPTLLYLPLDPESAPLVRSCVKRIEAETIVLGADDEPEVLRRRVANLWKPSVPSLVLRNLAESLDRLPAEMGVAVTGLFAWRLLPATAGELVAQMETPEGALRAHLDRSGLAGPCVLLRAARMARSWHLIVRPRADVVRIASRLGVSRRSLESYFRDHLNTSLRRGPRNFTAEEVAERLTALLQTREL